jgi:hypothetical protein
MKKFPRRARFSTASVEALRAGGRRHGPLRLIDAYAKKLAKIGELVFGGVISPQRWQRSPRSAW